MNNGASYEYLSCNTGQFLSRRRLRTGDVGFVRINEVLKGRLFAKKPVFYITRILFSAGSGNIFYYQFPWLYRNRYDD